LGPD
jgi:hypothetical protein